MPVDQRVKDFRKAVRYLKKALPTRFPVSVHLTAPPAYWRVGTSGEATVYGDCDFVDEGKDPRFKIRINNDVLHLPRFGADWAVDTLLHEYAHVLAWTPEHMKLDDHGPEWGLAMSRVYRAYFQEKFS